MAKNTAKTSPKTVAAAGTATKLRTKDKALTPAWYVAKRVLRSHGYTLADIVTRLGVSQTTASDILNYAPNILRVKQLSEAFDIPFFDFFDFSQDASAGGDGIALSSSNAPAGAASEKAVPQSKAIVTCPHCGETLITTLSAFPK